MKLTQEQVIEENKKGQSLSNLTLHTVYKQIKHIFLFCFSKPNIDIFFTFVKIYLFNLIHMTIIKKSAITSVKYNPFNYLHLSKSLKNDTDIILAAVYHRYWFTHYLSSSVKNDKNIMLTLIKNNALCLKYASHRLQNNKELVLEAVKKDGLSLKYASEKLRNNPEIVYSAIKKSPESLKFASDFLRSDPNFILSILPINTKILNYIHPALKLKISHNHPHESLLKLINTEKPLLKKIFPSSFKIKFLEP